MIKYMKTGKRSLTSSSKEKIIKKTKKEKRTKGKFEGDEALGRTQTNRNSRIKTFWNSLEHMIILNSLLISHSKTKATQPCR